MSIFEPENDRLQWGSDTVAMELWRRKALASNNPAWIAQLSSADIAWWIKHGPRQTVTDICPIATRHESADALQRVMAQLEKHQ